MYQINDTVLYGTQGICRVSEITEMDMGGQKAEYYVLKPIYDAKSTIFVPLHNAVLTNKMRRILSAEEIHAFIKSMPEEEAVWIDNENERKEYYKKIIASGDRAGLVRMIKTLYLRQQKQKAHGKKLYMADERFLKEAEKILYEEFAYVLQIQREQVVPLIMEQIELPVNPQA